MPATVHPDLARGRTPVWLLDLEWAGRTWRLTSGEDADVVLDDGTHRYLGSLTPPAVSEDLDLWASEAGVVSVSIELLPPAALDVCALLAAGHILAAATGTLRLCYDATTAAGTRDVLVGRVVQPVYGPVGTVLAFALETLGDVSSSTLPPADAVVDATTWSGYGDPAVQGRGYPEVIGYPGGHDSDPTSAATFTRGSPALWVSGDSGGFNHILIAGHPVQATSAYVWNNTDPGKSFSASILETADGRGRIVSTVAWPALASKPAEGDDLWVGWDPAGNGGARNPYGSGVLEGAGDVIRWALDRSGRRWDRARASELRALNGICIGTYVSETVDPWDWLRSEILPLLPVSVTTSGAGIRVVPWRYAATARDAVLALEHGRNAERASFPVFEWPSVANRITLRYAMRADTGELLSHRTAAHALDPADSDVFRHPLCVRSVAALRTTHDPGVRALVVDAPVIGDRASAGLIVEYLVRRYALPYETIEYDVRPDVAEALDLGSVVTLDDADLSWSSRVCHLLRRTYDGPWARLLLGRWETA